MLCRIPPPSTAQPKAPGRDTRHRPTWAGAWAGLAVGLVLPWVGGAPSVAEPAPEPPPAGGSETVSPSAIRRLPQIAPDYVGVVLPPNLAPLNFNVREPGAEYRLRLAGPRGQPLELQQATPAMRLPLPAWKELLQANQGAALQWNISVRDDAGRWVAYAPYETPVAREAIDPYLFYRRIQPLYSTYKHMGIYQRHLETFEEKPILRNEKIGHGCVNCHTPYPGATDRFAVSFRGRFGTPTLLIESNRITRVDTKMSYLAWHPSGKLLAFATNAITQFFHLAGPLNRDTYDGQSGIKLYHLDSRGIEQPEALDAPDRIENWPAWAADGRSLYYVSGPRVEFRDVATLRCDLMRAAYDPEQNSWGSPEVLVSSGEHQLSVNQPRPSPEGRYLIFTGSHHGTFPLFYPDSDLFLLRLGTRVVERLPINSPYAETFHNWSGNGRWLVFASRGLDGVFARVMLTHVDAEARCSKPLLLPQEDPDYYETCLHNFNVPELGRGPIQVSEDDLVRVLNPSGNSAAPLALDHEPTYTRE